MSTGRRQMKTTRPIEKPVLVFDYTAEDVKKEPSGSKEAVKEGKESQSCSHEHLTNPGSLIQRERTEKTCFRVFSISWINLMVDELTKKCPVSHLEMEAGSAVGNGVLVIAEEFRADINRMMQARKERLEYLTRCHMKGSQRNVEELWRDYLFQRQKVTQQYSQQVSCALQQWEAEAQQVEELEERFTNLLMQQQMVLKQARAAQAQTLRAISEMFKQFGKNMEDMDKSHEAFLQGAQQKLRKEMVTLQKKLIMHTQRQEMATVCKTLQSMF